MLRRARIFAVAAVAALSSTAVHAQHPLVLERLRAMNAAAPQPDAAIIQEQVLKAALAAQKSSGGCIPTIAKIETVLPATSIRYVFSGILAGRLKNGWTVTAYHPNCDAVPVRYTIFEESSGALNTVRTNRGSSLANETLIGDTWPLALLQAVAALKRAGIDCDPKVQNLGVTRIAKEEPGLGEDVYGVRYAGSWSEIWPVEVCGRTVEVTVRFTADGDGGAHTDLPGAAVKLLPASAAD